MIVVFGVFLLEGCGSQNIIENDLEKMNLKGNVEFLKEESGESSDIFLFDQNGMKIREISKMGDQGFRVIKYNYQSGKLSSSDSKTIMRNYISEDVSTLKYDIDGILTSEESKDYTNIYKYNEKGNVIEVITDWKNKEFQKESIQKNFYSNASLDSSVFTNVFPDNSNSIQKVYFKNGLVTSTVYLHKGEVSHSGQYEYDKNGNQISFTFKDYSDGKINESKKKFEYSYDPNGNWIEKKTLEEDRVTNITKRTLVYQGGDYTSYISEYGDIINEFPN